MLGLSFDIEKMIITFHFIAYLLQTESGIIVTIQSIDYSQDMLLLIMSYNQCKIPWCSYLNVSLKVKC